MPAIVLARHGKPDWDYKTPIPGYSLGEWVQGLDHAPIDASLPPSVDLQHLARSSDYVATSPLRRSLESAHLLAPDKVALVDALFREVYLPCAYRSGLRLPPKFWVVPARCAWFCGWSPQVESFSEARRRAAAAARVLAAIAAEHGQTLLIGHSTMNSLIAMRLLRAGWRGPWLHSRRYWAFAVYERDAA